MAEQHPRIEELRRRVDKDPASIAFAQLAEEYRRAGQFEEAVAVCTAGLARHPGYLSARVTLGRALIELGQLETAQQELDTVLAGAPDNLAAIRGLGDIFHRRGASKEALALYRRALGLARNDPDLQQVVAELTRHVARVPAGIASPNTISAAKSDASGLLSLGDFTQELQKVAQQPVETLVARPFAGTPPTPAALADAERQQLATLERWLNAIDEYRAERRP